MEQDLVELLASRPAGCRLWPEQTEGPYHRDAPPQRSDITEDRLGVPLRVGLRLLAAGSGAGVCGLSVSAPESVHVGARGTRTATP